MLSTFFLLFSSIARSRISYSAASPLPSLAFHDLIAAAAICSFTTTNVERGPLLQLVGIIVVAKVAENNLKISLAAFTFHFSFFFIIIIFYVTKSLLN